MGISLVGSVFLSFSFKRAMDETNRRKLPYWLAQALPILICLAHFIILASLANRHPIGNFATETDFYHYYAPDAERISQGEFPSNTYQGPGYPALLALITKLIGSDLFTTGKWLSVIGAVICGFLVFLLFGRLFGYWVGIGAQAITIVSGEFPQFAINATTDVLFLLLCLLALVIFIYPWFSMHSRMAIVGILAGFAYLTRYNGIFLLIAFIIGIFLLNQFEQNRRHRLKLSAIVLLTFFVTISPWLYANYKYRGSPFYNTNYLNLATEFYPELVAGKTNQDGTRALEEKFHSAADVLRYDPMRVISHYPFNFYETLRLSIKDSLVAELVGWSAWLGIIFVLIKRRSKDLALVLIIGAIYLLLIALTHWETRYCFFIMALYSGFAVYGVTKITELLRMSGLKLKIIVPAVSVLLVGVMWVSSVAESRQDVIRFLAGHPIEILAARDYLNDINPQGARLRVVARKPHLPYLSRNEWVFFPQVKSIDELRLWVEGNNIDYIAIGRRELKERKELTPLGDPKNAPAWLKAVWVYENPVFILYKPEIKAE